MPYTSKRRPSEGPNGWNERFAKHAHEVAEQMNRATRIDRSRYRPEGGRHKVAPPPPPEPMPETMKPPAQKHLYQGRTSGQWDALVTFSAYQGTENELAKKKGIPVTAWVSDRLPGVLRVWSRAERPAAWWKGATFRCPTCNARTELDGDPKAGHSATFVCRYCSNHNYD